MEGLPCPTPCGVGKPRRWSRPAGPRGVRQEGPFFASPGELVISHRALAVVCGGEGGGVRQAGRGGREAWKHMCVGVVEAFELGQENTAGPEGLSHLPASDSSSIEGAWFVAAMVAA